MACCFRARWPARCASLHHRHRTQRQLHPAHRPHRRRAVGSESMHFRRARPARCLHHRAVRHHVRPDVRPRRAWRRNGQRSGSQSHRGTGSRLARIPKLKLMGVDAASFEAFLADEDTTTRTLPGTGTSRTQKIGPTATDSPGAFKNEVEPPSSATAHRPMLAPAAATSRRCPRRCCVGVYREYVLTPDGKHIFGGMIASDVQGFTKPIVLCEKRQPTETARGCEVCHLVVGSSLSSLYDECTM